ncbi:hypothetical protein A3D80_03435 [Candidatus Roizmanbacteria bacterium RIFCSPHIGHO2_02_FULL_40_13b]|uniref:Predicted 3'-5' exonuclease PolB-like domain-containing protein n=1 Tax=Candidatus Roizmanbacteria bacterium RIFCSPHIGHO2_01_FULL_39_24 TaxID=1802032 RepID=A0A1F7GJJ4_9BACT|nr:MAG: hypothetical protein A2799_04380 [Candidatus Roizmanbacteria bacterium RIFCSPHIGHO2_01_FULL_39_24]OGK27019.1 MAG: hypothetical protein A3D80_03435 [Candidatus Roizmanbacteria bacterium RIFCSPHIGHO2_02_FULL_40_13b]OGK48826.1 MAG: hypothetical protein A3A56_01290 [Candidatus Roizmanbacteria bacterium RIFCSPLOWO2_01_FULL_40_32]
MTKLFFDIETIPVDESMKNLYLEIKSKKDGEGLIVEKVDELIAKTSFDGTFGRICCIGYIKEGSQIERGVLKGDEKQMLSDFWRIAADVYQFIGHNIFEFDLPFIYQRSIIHGVKPRLELSFAKYRSMPFFDTMSEWGKWGYGKNVKLDTLAKVFGFPTSKDVMDGSQVWPYFQEGKIEEICVYCMKDVELTRQVYYKMMVETMP